MRLRFSKLIVLGVLASALLATAASVAIAGSAGSGDSAVGGLRGVGGVNAIALSAHSDANGANPYGNLSQTIPAGKPAAATQGSLRRHLPRGRRQPRRHRANAQQQRNSGQLPTGTRPDRDRQRQPVVWADGRFLRVPKRNKRLPAVQDNSGGQPPGDRQHPRQRPAVEAAAQRPGSSERGCVRKQLGESNTPGALILKGGPGEPRSQLGELTLEVSH